MRFEFFATREKNSMGLFKTRIFHIATSTANIYESIFHMAIRCAMFYRRLLKGPGFWRNLEGSGSVWRVQEDPGGFWRVIESFKEYGRVWRFQEGPKGPWGLLEGLNRLGGV